MVHWARDFYVMLTRNLPSIYGASVHLYTNVLHIIKDVQTQRFACFARCWFKTRETHKSCLVLWLYLIIYNHQDICISRDNLIRMAIEALPYFLHPKHKDFVLSMQVFIICDQHGRPISWHNWSHIFPWCNYLNWVNYYIKPVLI